MEMRKSVVLGVAIMFACAIGSYAVAAQKKSSAPASKHVTAEVVSVDATAKTLTVKEKDKEITFTLAETAKIKIQGKEATLDQLKAGEKVQIKYTEKNGAQIAQEVVHTEKAPAKKG